MKKYILTHDTFIDDLRDAAEVARNHKRESLADNLSRHAIELTDFDRRSGWADPFHEDNIFRLDCGDSKSSWKRWQEQAFALAKEHDGQLFTYGTISDLVRVLNESTKPFKNAQPIRDPDWKFCWEYNIRPSVSIGEGCTIVFQPVRGYYLMEG